MGFTATYYFFFFFFGHPRATQCAKHFWLLLEHDSHLYLADQLGKSLPAHSSAGVLCLGFLEECGPGSPLNFA